MASVMPIATLTRASAADTALEASRTCSTRSDTGTEKGSRATVDEYSPCQVGIMDTSDLDLRREPEARAISTARLAISPASACASEEEEAKPHPPPASTCMPQPASWSLLKIGR